MSNYRDHLDTMRRNLELVEACHAKHPALFEKAGHTHLGGSAPQVCWWPWDGKPAEKQALARCYPDAGWTRYVDSGSVKATWKATIDGVEIALEGAEEISVPGHGTRVEFAPVLQEAGAA